METVVKRNTPDRIYQLIRKELITLNLKPGQLISENDLSNTYHTSRTTIRSVLTRLKTDGLVVVIAKSGTYVTRLDAIFDGTRCTDAFNEFHDTGN